MNRQEQGSVFFYILIAVALLAALSYAVSKGGRGGASAITEEQQKLAVQEVMEYGNTIAIAIQKLRLRGCADSQISFENPVLAGYENTGAPGDKTCHVFDSAGGNLDYSRIGGVISNEHWIFSTHNITDVGSAEAELTMILPIGTKTEICAALNDKTGVTNISGRAPVEDFDTTIKFTGDYDAGAGAAATIGNDSEGTSFHGKTEGCAINSAGNSQYYKVLLSR